MASVRDWANDKGFGYRFEDDALFARLPEDIFEKLLGGERKHVVVATDLARLYWLREVLESGAETALWLDADIFVCDPVRFTLPGSLFAVGREVWVQQGSDHKLQSYKKVHNAYLLFRRDNPFLSYYLHAAEQIIRQHNGRHMVPQLIGPKLLTALHNVVQCPVAERAGMLSALVLRNVLEGGGDALRLFLQRSPECPAAVNLCGSSVQSGEVSADEMLAVIACLPKALTR